MASDRGRFFSSMDAKAFMAGQLRSIRCRWCDNLLLLRIPTNAFLCATCDWAPHENGAHPPDGFAK